MEFLLEWITHKSQCLADKMNDIKLSDNERIGALNQKALIDEFLIDMQIFLNKEQEND